MIKRTKKYVYVKTPIEIIRIMEFWENKKPEYRKATELYFSSPEITIREIQQKYNVYISHVYTHFCQLRKMGLIYAI